MGQPCGIVLIKKGLFAPDRFTVEHTHIDRLRILGPVHIYIYIYITLHYHNLPFLGNPFPDHEFGIPKGTPQLVVFGDKQQIFLQAEDSQYPEIITHRHSFLAPLDLRQGVTGYSGPLGHLLRG